MNIEFEQFVQLIGGPKAAYEYLEYSEAMIYKIRHGKRAINPVKAKMITDRFPQLSFSRLLLPDNQAA